MSWWRAALPTLTGRPGWKQNCPPELQDYTRLTRHDRSQLEREVLVTMDSCTWPQLRRSDGGLDNFHAGKQGALRLPPDRIDVTAERYMEYIALSIRCSARLALLTVLGVPAHFTARPG
jgi:hypothetical protein